MAFHNYGKVNLCLAEISDNFSSNKTSEDVYRSFQYSELS